MSPFLTIFTPTYNRGYILPVLWESLCKQTNKNFVWVIIDDGSNDNTLGLVNKWKKSSPFMIQYVFQENSGKHVAINRALEICDTPLIMCVDSDDKLTKCAVETIDHYYESDLKTSNKLQGEIIGWVTRTGNMQGGVLRKSVWLSNEPRLTILELYEKYKYGGEPTTVWKTTVARNYRFPVIENEKFITESVIRYQMSFAGPIQLKNDIFRLSEYRDDGYTRQGIKRQINNPRGEAIMLKTRAIVRSGRRGLSALIKYYAWLRIFGISEQTGRTDYQGLKFGNLPIEKGCIERNLAKSLAYIWEPLIRRRIERRRQRLLENYKK